jgi:crotonobetainyl-CoA:carnitine CoA-transferase CaiB-like acyl-CoA transferase
LSCYVWKRQDKSLGRFPRARQVLGIARGNGDGSTPRSVSNVAALVGEPADEYVTRPKQAKNAERLDKLLSDWISTRPLSECLATMNRLQVTASAIYNVEDILSDPTYRERENIATIDDPELGKLRMQNVIPKLTNYTGSIWRSAPKLGEDSPIGR